jgi:hypothetical protein
MNLRNRKNILAMADKQLIDAMLACLTQKLLNNTCSNILSLEVVNVKKLAKFSYNIELILCRFVPRNIYIPSYVIASHRHIAETFGINILIGYDLDGVRIHKISTFTHNKWIADGFVKPFTKIIQSVLNLVENWCQDLHYVLEAPKLTKTQLGVFKQELYNRVYREVPKLSTSL